MEMCFISVKMLFPDCGCVKIGTGRSPRTNELVGNDNDGGGGGGGILGGGGGGSESLEDERVIVSNLTVESGLVSTSSVLSLSVEFVFEFLG